MSDKIIEPDVLKERKKLPKDIKTKIINLVFFNIIFLGLMAVITLVINVSFNKINVEYFKNYIKFIQLALCIISIVLFEVAYKKDSVKITFFAIEFVIFSCLVLFVPYNYISKSDPNFLKIVLGIFTVYYIVKSVYCVISIRHKYLKDNMSDVKEIVKDDEKKSYLDEDSKKTLKARKIEEENKKNTKQVKNTKKPYNKKSNNTSSQSNKTNAQNKSNNTSQKNSNKSKTDKTK